jgi:type III restriction enzyme
LGASNESGQPTQQIIENRRRAEFITPIPKPKSAKAKESKLRLCSTKEKDFPLTSSNMTTRPSSTPSAGRWISKAQACQHQRLGRNAGNGAAAATLASYNFTGIRPLPNRSHRSLIWLTEVAPQAGKAGDKFIQHPPTLTTTPIPS